MFRFIRRLCVLACLLLGAGCAATTMTGVWKNPDYLGGPLRKVLVIGVAENDTYRRIFEDDCSRRLRARGTIAVPSYTMFTGEELKEKDGVARKIDDQGYDAMLIAKILGHRTATEILPGRTYITRDRDLFYEPRYYRRGWHDYYLRSYEIVHEPPQVIQYDLMTAETKVFDPATERLIWSGLSETRIPETAEALFQSLTDALLKSLAEAGLLR